MTDNYTGSPERNKVDGYTAPSSRCYGYGKCRYEPREANIVNTVTTTIDDDPPISDRNVNKEE